MKSRFSSVQPQADSDQSDGEKQLMEKQQELLMSQIPSKKKRPLIAKEKKQFDSADFFMKGDENGSPTTSDEVGQDDSQNGESSNSYSKSQTNPHKSKMNSNFSSKNGHNQNGNDDNCEDEDDNNHIQENNHSQYEAEQKRLQEEQEEAERLRKQKEVEEQKERERKQKEEEERKRKQKEEEERIRIKKEQERVKQEQERIKKEQEDERQRKEKEEIEQQENKRIEQERKRQISNSAKKYALDDEEEDNGSEQYDMLMKKNAVKKPLITKQKKTFDSADYFMKEEHDQDDGSNNSSDNKEDSEKKVIVSKTNYSKSSFKGVGSNKSPNNSGDNSKAKQKSPKFEQSQNKKFDQPVEDSIKISPQENDQYIISQNQNGNEDNDIAEQAQMMMKKNLVKKPLIAKQKKTFDSADYFMKDDHKEDGNEQNDSSENKDDSDKKVIEVKSNYSKSSFKSSVETGNDNQSPINQIEKTPNPPIIETQHEKITPVQEQIINKQDNDQYSISKNQNDEDNDMAQQAQQMMMMKKNLVKKPLIAKQKKTFDSADYYMKDDHKDDGNDQNDSSENKDDSDKKVIEVKSNYSKSSFKSSVETGNDNQSPMNQNDGSPSPKIEEAQPEKTTPVQEQIINKQQDNDQYSISKNQNDEDNDMAQQAQQMMMMKKNLVKKPLIAKQKKTFDSADYYMKDDHKDDGNDQNDSSENKEDSDKKVIEVKSNYSKSSFKSTAETGNDNNATCQIDKSPSPIEEVQTEKINHPVQDSVINRQSNDDNHSFSQKQNGNQENDMAEQAQMMMKKNLVKKPLIAKQKKTFDSADYFMKDDHKDDDSGENDQSQNKDDSDKKVIEVKSNYSKSSFKSSINTNENNDVSNNCNQQDNKIEESNTEPIQKESTQQPAANSIKISFLDNPYQNLEAHLSGREDNDMAEQSQMMMKKNLVKKPLIAKQKKTFDSADYFMKDDHKDDDQDDSSENKDDTEKKVIETKSNYSKSSFKTSNDDDKQLNTQSNQQTQPTANSLKISFLDDPQQNLMIHMTGNDEESELANTIFISRSPKGVLPDGMSPRSNLSRSRAGSESRDKSRERKRVSFSLPADKNDEKDQKEGKEAEDSTNHKTNNIHSLKGSRFGRQPHGNVIESEVDEDNEQEKECGQQQPASIMNDQDKQKIFLDQLNKATEKFKQSKEKRKPLIKNDKKKVDFDSADYFLEEEKNKKKCFLSMPELQVPEDEVDAEDQIHYMKINIQRNQKHRKSYLAEQNKSKVRSMPELLGDGPHFSINSDDWRKQKKNTNESNNLDKIVENNHTGFQNDQIKEDTSDDDDDSDDKKLGVEDDKPSQPTYSSIEDEDDFLPKITQSKITNSKFQKYKNQVNQSDDDEDEELEEIDQNKLQNNLLNQQKEENSDDDENEEEKPQQQTNQNKKSAFSSDQSSSFKSEKQSVFVSERQSAFASQRQASLAIDQDDPEPEQNSVPVQTISHQESEQLLHEQSKNVSQQAKEEHEAYSIDLPIAKKKKNLLNKDKKKEFDSADFFMKDK